MVLRTLRSFVAVAGEVHFGRAVARLRMPQPLLSRAIRQLETAPGCALLSRPPAGVALTPVGTALHDEVRALRGRADQMRARVFAAPSPTAPSRSATASPPTGNRPRRTNPHPRGGPDRPDHRTAGRPRGRGSDPGSVRRHRDRRARTALGLGRRGAACADDPLAGRDTLCLDDLADRRWFRFPDGTDS